MRREDFDRLYTDAFPILVNLLIRRGVEDGADALQSVYVMVVEDKSYKMMSVREGLHWLRQMMWRRIAKQRRQHYFISLKEEE